MAVTLEYRAEITMPKSVRCKWAGLGEGAGSDFARSSRSTGLSGTGRPKAAQLLQIVRPTTLIVILRCPPRLRATLGGGRVPIGERIALQSPSAP